MKVENGGSNLIEEISYFCNIMAVVRTRRMRWGNEVYIRRRGNGSLPKHVGLRKSEDLSTG